MKYWNLHTPLSFMASCIWNLSEFFGITLGKYGVTIFNLMIQKRGKRIMKQKYWETSYNVELTEYCEKTKSLIIQYRNGKRYMYDDVPKKIWAELIEAESIGSFLHRHVKGNYNYIDVTGI